MRSPEHKLDFAISDGGSDDPDSSSSADERALKKAESAQAETVFAVDDEQLRSCVKNSDLEGSIQRIIELSNVTGTEHIRRQKSLIARLFVQAARDAFFVHDNEKFGVQLLKNLNSPFLRENTDETSLRNTALNSVLVMLKHLKGYQNSQETGALIYLFEETVQMNVNPDTKTALDEIREPLEKAKAAARKAEAEKAKLALEAGKSATVTEAQKGGKKQKKQHKFRLF